MVLLSCDNSPGRHYLVMWCSCGKKWLVSLCMLEIISYGISLKCQSLAGLRRGH